MKHIYLFDAVVCAIGFLYFAFSGDLCAACGYFCATTGWMVAYLNEIDL